MIRRSLFFKTPRTQFDMLLCHTCPFVRSAHTWPLLIRLLRTHLYLHNTFVLYVANPRCQSCSCCQLRSHIKEQRYAVRFVAYHLLLITRRLSRMYTRTSYSSSHETNITRDLKVKAKEVDLYSAFVVVPHTEGVQLRITQCYLQITMYLPPPHKRSPDGASPDWGCGHLIAAYYSVIYPERMKG